MLVVLNDAFFGIAEALADDFHSRYRFQDLGCHVESFSPQQTFANDHGQSN